MDDWRLPRQATCAIMALAVIGFPITALGDTPPPPSNLHRTQDAGECAAHGGTGDCTKLSDPNFVVLVWDGESTASRYAVWRIHGKTDANIGDVQYVNDPTPSLPTFFSFTGVTPYACYAVSGVDNTGVASELSAPWCMPGTIANVVHGNPVGRLRSAERPAVPTDLRETNSVSVCQRHNGNFACADLRLVSNTVMVLVWNGEAVAEKYTLYRIDGAHRVFVASNTGEFNGVIPTAIGISNVRGACYAVTESLNGWESAPSVTDCPVMPANL